MLLEIYFDIVEEDEEEENNFDVVFVRIFE